MQLISAEYTFRLDVEDGVGIPQIPVHPIGYNDAEIFLRYSFLVVFENKIYYTKHLFSLLKPTYVKSEVLYLNWLLK